jgi:hypothetical protein
MELINGERLIFQVEFTNSLFGSDNLNQFDVKYATTEKSKYKNTYKLFVKFK